MKTKGARNKKGVTRRLVDAGHYEIFEPSHPLAMANGYVAEHRKVAYDAGLLSDSLMIVTHKNGIRTDNRLSNLEISGNRKGKVERNKLIVYLKDVKKLSFSKIGEELNVKSKARVYEIYWREKAGIRRNPKRSREKNKLSTV